MISPTGMNSRTNCSFTIATISPPATSVAANRRPRRSGIRNVSKYSPLTLWYAKKARRSSPADERRVAPPMKPLVYGIESAKATSRTPGSAIKAPRSFCMRSCRDASDWRLFEATGISATTSPFTSNPMGRDTTLAKLLMSRPAAARIVTASMTSIAMSPSRRNRVPRGAVTLVVDEGTPGDQTARPSMRAPCLPPLRCRSPEPVRSPVPAIRQPSARDAAASRKQTPRAREPSSRPAGRRGRRQGRRWRPPPRASAGSDVRGLHRSPRTPSSLRRDEEYASSRLAKLAQAMSRSNPAAPCRSRRPGRMPSLYRSTSGVSETPRISFPEDN